MNLALKQVNIVAYSSTSRESMYELKSYYNNGNSFYTMLDISKCYICNKDTKYVLVNTQQYNYHPQYEFSIKKYITSCDDEVCQNIIILRFL